MLTRSYVRLVRVLRSMAGSVGLLQLLDRFTDRRAVHWLRSQFEVHDVEGMVRLGVPWWSYAAADDVDAWLAARPGRLRAFEWGSGASTIWLAERVEELHSVEHHSGFAATVRAIAPEHATIHVVEPEPGGSTTTVTSDKPGNEGLDFASYANRIDEVGGPFDVIVIDGRVRAACLDRALRHLAPDGLVVFDNSSRSRYRVAIEASGLVEQRFRGATPAYPVASTTSLLTAAQAEVPPTKTTST